MTGDAVAEEAAGGPDADGDPPSSATIRLLDRRTPGGTAAALHLDEARLRELSERLAPLLDRPVDVAVALLDDVEMDRLHRTHSGVPGTTDVLAFPGEDPSRIAGDLAVGVEVAAREARTRGRSLESELMLYVVHGVLHLSGERDHDAASRERMTTAQDRLLEALGLPATEGGERPDAAESPEASR